MICIVLAASYATQLYRRKFPKLPLNDGEKSILDWLPDGILVITGDNLLDFSLIRFIAYAREKGTSCVMRYREPSMDQLRKCGV